LGARAICFCAKAGPTKRLPKYAAPPIMIRVFLAPAVTVAWNFFEGDVPQISQKIGDSVPIKAALSTFLAKQKRFDEAFLLWNALSARR
jgi:hypothetical protein